VHVNGINGNALLQQHTSKVVLKSPAANAMDVANIEEVGNATMLLSET